MSRSSTADREARRSVAAGLHRTRSRAPQSFPADVSVGSEVAAAVAAVVEAFGGIDIVSNNAGIQRYGTVETTSEAEWDEVIDVNLKSVYLVCHHAIPHLRHDAGRDRQHGIGAVLRHAERRRRLYRPASMG